MNFVPVHGSSSSAYAVTYGPDTPAERLADFYQGYHYGTLDAELMSRKKFTTLVRGGQVINSGVWQDGILKAIWGNEVNQVGDRRWLSFLYMTGQLPAPVLHKVALQTWKLARAAQCIDTAGRTRVYIRGRKGWRRKLARIGLRVDEMGFVIDDEAGFLPKIGILSGPVVDGNGE